MVQDKIYLQKLSDLLSGENNPMWRGGIANKNYNGFYRKLKNEIRQRDNYSCQLCLKTETDLGYTLSVHHIDFDKENSELPNLIALCKVCNSRINFDRDKWRTYFENIMRSRLGVDQ